MHRYYQGIKKGISQPAERLKQEGWRGEQQILDGVRIFTRSQGLVSSRARVSSMVHVLYVEQENQRGDQQTWGTKELLPAMDVLSPAT